VTGWFPRSLRTRSFAAIMAGVGSATLAIVAVMVALALTGERRGFLQRTELAGKLVGEYLVAPLAFGDLDGARRALAKLDDIPAMVSARVLGEDGKLLASWERTGAVPVVAEPPPLGGHRFGAGVLELHLPVAYQGASYGSLHLSASLEELVRRRAEILATAAVALAGVLLSAWLLARSLARNLSGPVLDLAATMDRVSREQDFTLRAEVRGADEVAELCRGFNDMLGQIEARRLQREQDQARLARLAAAVEHAGEAVVIADAEGCVQYVNPAFTQSSGHAPQDAVGRGLAELSAPDADDPAAEAVRRVVRQGTPWSGRLVGRRRDGSPLLEDATLSSIRGPGGAVVGWVAVKRDVTQQVAERRRAREEILTLNRELEARVVQRTAALEEANTELESFAYSVSHDLRAPLRHVGGFLTLLRDHLGPGLDGRARHLLEAAVQGAVRMGTLIDDLLAFSRMGRKEMARAEVDLAALAREVLDELEPEQRGRAVRTEIGALPAVIGDRAMLRVVLTNLLSNALKFTRPRAEAVIRVASEPGAPGEQVVSVQDNGVGFDPAYADQLFQVFHRLHRDEDFEGVGAGLANVRRVIARHGGRTWATGQVDGGATFYFSLPVRPPG
jgi:PAS domain S-box-containing protein